MSHNSKFTSIMSKTKEERNEDLLEKENFAKICVEVDLRKQFLLKFKITNRIHQVEYKMIHSIYFSLWQI